MLFRSPAALGLEDFENLLLAEYALLDKNLPQLDRLLVLVQTSISPVMTNHAIEAGLRPRR